MCFMECFTVDLNNCLTHCRCQRYQEYSVSYFTVHHSDFSRGWKHFQKVLNFVNKQFFKIGKIEFLIETIFLFDFEKMFEISEAVKMSSTRQRVDDIPVPAIHNALSSYSKWSSGMSWASSTRTAIAQGQKYNLHISRMYTWPQFQI